jgi:hypothetical protein
MSEQLPPYPGPQPPPYGSPYGPPYGLPPYNTYAILSLVFALAVFPPLGIYFGYKAKQQIAQTGERGGELASAGLICGWIFSVLMGLFFLAWCGFGALMIISATTS